MLTGNGRITAIFAPSEMLVPGPGICDDPVFNAHAEQDLVWLPSLGVGYLPVTEQPYDADYFAKYEGYALTPMGRAITAARVALVERHAQRRNLLDVGIGSGDFLDAIGGRDIARFGFDVNPVAVEWLRERGLFLDPYDVSVDVLTFWDSLEHIPDVHRMIANARRWVFCSLPIVPGDGPPRADWKHYRTDEHCWYFTRRGLIRWMDAQGFDCVECNASEDLLGREDIETFAFRRRA